MNAKPAMFENCASKPLTFAMPTSPMAEPRAHGLMSKWDAPAEPTRSSFPPNPKKEMAEKRMML